MAKSGEFYTFDEVVRQLKIDENKLKRLVSEGEISAFREGDVMKFKKAEIDKLSKKGTAGDTSETVLSEITLEDEGGFKESGETLTDDLVFEGASDEVDLGRDTSGMKTEEISSQDTFIEEDKGDVGMTTEPIDLSADLTQEVVEEEVEEVDEGPRRRAAAPSRTTTRRATMAQPAGNPGITFALVVTTVLVFLALTIVWRGSMNELSGTNSDQRPLKGSIFEKMAGIGYGMGTEKTVKNAITAETHDATTSTGNSGK